MRKIFLTVALILLLSACQPGQGITPGNTKTPEATLAPTQTLTPTVEPTKELTAENLVPLYQVTQSAVLTEADLFPYVDIMTGAHDKLVELGVGEELDEKAEDLIDITNAVYQRTHTLEPIFALNTQSSQSIYTFFIYDHTGDCLYYPLITSPTDGTVYATATTGDQTELESALAQHPDARIWFKKVSIPAGMLTDSEIKLIGTKTGIVPAIYYQGIHVAWLDPVTSHWQMTDLARTYIENDYRIAGVEEGIGTNLANWLNGTTVIDKSLIFEVSAGQKMKFNVFVEQVPSDGSEFGKYYGVLLGSKVIEDHLFIFMGYEDAASTRYYLPFNLGSVTDENCGVTFRTTGSNLGDFTPGLDRTSWYSCQDLDLVLRYFFNQPVAISQYISAWEAIPFYAELEAGLQEQYSAQQEYAMSLAAFINGSANSAIGDNNFNGLINPPLEAVTVEKYPVSFIDFALAKD